MITFNKDASAFDLQTYKTSLGIQNPYARDPDGSLFDSYEALDPPTYLILDQDGIVRYRTDGEDNFNVNAMKQMVDELLGF